MAPVVGKREFPYSPAGIKAAEAYAKETGQKVDMPTKRGDAIAPQTTSRPAKSNFIAGAIKKPGALHREMGVPQGKKIPEAKLEAAAKKSGKLGRRARFALMLMGLARKRKSMMAAPVAGAA